jgi:hypothetical protein
MATATERGSGGVQTASLTGLHWAGIALAAITGVIHLFLGVSFAPSGLGISFLVAGVGFLAGIGLVLLGYRSGWVYALGAAFTAGQIVLWYYLNFAAGPKSFPGGVGTLGAVDKIAQVLLLVVLGVLYARS